MLAFTLRRVVSLVPVLFGVSVVVFLFLHLLPGDVATTLAGERASDATLERIRGIYGLDQPLHVQYLLYAERLLRLDLGRSVYSSLPVMEEFRARFPATVELAIAALLIAVLIGVPAGILSATRRGSPIDYGSMTLSLMGVSMPIFWLGLLLIWIFAIQLKWLPPGGRLDPTLRFESSSGFLVLDALVAGNWPILVAALRHLALPAFALSTIPMAIIARITRAAMLEVVRQDYVRTARAKGLKEGTVVLRHALKNAMLPVVTIVGLQVGLLLSGAILTETIFSWPGIGRWVFEAILRRDYPVVQGATLVIATIFVAVNLIVDLTYAALDPRIRYR